MNGSQLQGIAVLDITEPVRDYARVCLLKQYLNWHELQPSP